ncbi:hypothetical protein KXJ69_09340 [Aureisphaera sp. CAU 1614]|uniref:ATPase domain-containing protein n=1 Tax=Halomarinibacterium sedimenti TaxID=2857106 RepID=A0A9X1FPA0_9FLAO|nr:hypothetical protein [Halomarinibacterium sedimenti]MBW2938308.1 hypothetical protein [Halomarinibacterium sedimenti]
MENNLPFKYGKLVTEDFFVNRTEEIAQISSLLTSKINVTLISPRRWGKSSLFFKIAHDLEKKNPKIKFCFIDLFKTRNEREFYEYFASEVLKASYSKWEERLEKAKVFFKHLIPKFSFGVDPTQEFSVSLDWEEVQKHPQEILDLPEVISKEKGIHIIICLVEFQNISHFNDSLGFQKKLRASWQTHQHCSYAIYGSKQHMMTEIFEKKSMPFYKFGEILFLSKIDNTHWCKYIVKRFKKTGKSISAKYASKIASLVDNHPYFVQQLANSVWICTTDKCSETEIEMGLKNLLNQYDLIFSRELDGLSNLQLNLLKAIAYNEEKLSSKKTIDKYHLSSSASVNRSKEALIQKEIIDTFHQQIAFLDPLFKIWFKTVYLK